jgi:hypothetical protein
MNDIETALQSCPNWGNTERLLLKAQQHIAGLQREIEAQTKPLSDDVLGAYEYQLQRAKLFKEMNHIKETNPLSDEDIDEILESLDVYIDTHAGVKLFARAIEAKVRGH